MTIQQPQKGGVTIPAIMIARIRPGEQVIYHSKPHWIILARGAFWTVIALVCTLCSILVGTTDPPPGQPPPPEGLINTLITCGACLFALALFSTLVALSRYLASDFVLTNQRVIEEIGGIIGKRSKEIYIKQIDSVVVHTPLLGNIFGYGSIIIKSGASDIPLANYANPQDIRHNINHQISQ